MPVDDFGSTGSEFLLKCHRGWLPLPCQDKLETLAQIGVVPHHTQGPQIWLKIAEISEVPSHLSPI